LEETFERDLVVKTLSLWLDGRNFFRRMACSPGSPTAQCTCWRARAVWRGAPPGRLPALCPRGSCAPWRPRELRGHHGCPPAPATRAEAPSSSCLGWSLHIFSQRC